MFMASSNWHSMKCSTHDPNTNSIGSHREEIDKHGNSKFQNQQNSLPGPLVSVSVRQGTNSRVFGNIDGISRRVDRLKGVGNAIVPQIPYEIFKAIEQRNFIIINHKTSTMKRTDLIEAARDLNSILGLDPAINLNGTDEEMTGDIKSGSLWLLENDPIKTDTIKVMRELGWEDSDFEGLDDEQNPKPLFAKYNIWPAVEEKPKAKRASRKKKEDPVPEEPETVSEVPETVPEPEETVPEEPETVPEPEVEEHDTTKQPKGSAYGTAIVILNANPTMPLKELYEEIIARGFDKTKSGASVKTAHSIFKKIYRGLDKNGFIK